MSEGTVSTERINQQRNKSDTQAGAKRPDGGAVDDQGHFLSKFTKFTQLLGWAAGGWVLTAPRSPGNLGWAITRHGRIGAPGSISPPSEFSDVPSALRINAALSLVDRRPRPDTLQRGGGDCGDAPKRRNFEWRRAQIVEVLIE